MSVEKLPAARIKGRKNMVYRVERVVKQRCKRRQPKLTGEEEERHSLEAYESSYMISPLECELAHSSLLELPLHDSSAHWLRYCNTVRHRHMIHEWGSLEAW